MIKAGEVGRCGAGGALFLDLEGLEFAMASFLDEVDGDSEGCAGVGKAPLHPSDASLPCLFFFLVMLVSQVQKAMAPEVPEHGGSKFSTEGGSDVEIRHFTPKVVAAVQTKI